MLSIRLLGAPQITYNQRPVTMTRRKSRALIYYLAAHPTPLTREKLLAFFWPDHHRPTAQQNLRATLYGLRKILGALLLVDDDTLALSSDTDVDTRTFEARLSALAANLPHLKETLDLYRGDFLNGFTLPDLPEFDDWAMVERERYRRLAVGGLTRLSHLYEAQQDFRAGLETLDQALAFDPLQEDLQRLALRLHYLAGDRAGAIRRYENFRHMLADEMGVPPMEETRALYDSIITDTLSLEIWPVPSPLSLGKGKKARLSLTVKTLPFVGREMELQKLNELATASKLVLIEGEPGIGKSRLMEQFIQTKPKPVLILIGQARELESNLPYHPVIEVLRGILNHPDWPALRLNLNLPPLWLTEAARLLPELAPAGHDSAAITQTTDEIRLWEGVSQFLLALARQQPLMLILDDLHWADSSTLGLLNYLIRKSSQTSTPIFFVAASHPAEPRHRLFHRRVAEAMETLYRHRPDSVAGLLAQHYAEGGAPERAAKYAFRAGQLAADLAAWSEAIAFFEQALAASESFADPAQRQPILAALGQVCLHAGQYSRASEVLRAALDLTGAIAHIQKAEALLRQLGKESQPAEGVVTLNQIKFELGNNFARRGDLPTAIQHYREGLEVTRSMDSDAMLRGHILFYNNLAYHLHLLPDPTAAEYARQGLALAQEKGVLSLLPYLWSTLGEIALAQNDLAAAEQHFNEGLSLAQQFSVPERIAGFTANLGLVAKQRGQPELAVARLSSALTQAEELNLRHLAVQIRLWLIPLLPPAEARAHFAAARSTAEHDGYERLLAEAIRLETEIQ